jgi:hypothetical protein
LSSFILARWSIYNDSSPRHFLPLRVPHQGQLGRNTMRHPTLFPPPGTVETLPENVVRETRRLLVELILAVLAKPPANPASEKETDHEQA